MLNLASIIQYALMLEDFNFCGLSLNIERKSKTDPIKKEPGSLSLVLKS